MPTQDGSCRLLGPMAKLDLSAEMQPDELGELLVGFAQQARRLAQQGDVARLHQMLSSVRAAADEAAGEQLRLLELAESFLRAIARSDLGRTEVELRRFVLEHADNAGAFLRALLERGWVTQEDFEGLPHVARDAAQALQQVGALRGLPHGRWDIRPSLRGVARDLVSPPALRMWERVESVRAQASRDALNAQKAAELLASSLGITEKESLRHLSQHPLALASISRPMMASAADDPATANASLISGGASLSLRQVAESTQARGLLATRTSSTSTAPRGTQLQ